MFELLHTSMLFDPATFGVRQPHHALGPGVMWSSADGRGRSRVVAVHMRMLCVVWSEVDLGGGWTSGCLSERLSALFKRAGPAEGWQGTLSIYRV